MTGFHMLLGLAVVALNAIAGVRGLILQRSGETDAALGVWAHGSLIVQVASGFFLFTATSEGPTIWHYVLPGAAIVGIILARSRDGRGRVRAVGAASLFAAAASLVAYLTGLAHG